jgi:heme-degrading monooxygenase HmoA
VFPPAPPWKALSTVEPDREYLVFTSRFFLRSVRRVPAFIAFSRRIGRQANAASGMIGWSLAADLPKLEFHTLSVWDERASLSAFFDAPPHRDAVRQFAGDLRRPTLFAEYTVVGRDLPVNWADAVSHQELGSR